MLQLTWFLLGPHPLPSQQIRELEAEERVVVLEAEESEVHVVVLEAEESEGRVVAQQTIQTGTIYMVLALGDQCRVREDEDIKTSKETPG